MSVAVCHNCKFSVVDLETGVQGQGFCRRFPPLSHIVPTPSGPMVMSQFPTVKLQTQWCGEHQFAVSSGRPDDFDFDSKKEASP